MQERATMSEESQLIAAKQKPQPARPKDRKCYTTKFGCIPFTAACAELKEALRQAPADEINANGQPKCCTETCCSISTGSAVMFVAAAGMTLFSFPHGVIRDGIRIISNYCIPDEQQPEVENADESPIIDCNVNTPTT